MAARIAELSHLWSWDESYRSIVIGKLTRGSAQIRGLEPKAAAEIVEMCGEGCGLYHALKRSNITQRQYFAWIAKSHCDDPDAEPYRAFRNRLRQAYDRLSARTGRRDDAGLLQLGLMGRDD